MPRILGNMIYTDFDREVSRAQRFHKFHAVILML